MVKNADDINIPTRFFVEDGGKNGKALKKKLDESTQSFLTVIDNEKDRKELAQLLHVN